MSNIIYLNIYQQQKKKLCSVVEYIKKLESLNKIELLDEMVLWREKRNKIPNLTLDLIQIGIPLFKLLSEQSETQELKIITTQMYKHLQYELEEMGKKGDLYGL